MLGSLDTAGHLLSCLGLVFMPVTQLLFQTGTGPAPHPRRRQGCGWLRLRALPFGPIFNNSALGPQDATLSSDPSASVCLWDVTGQHFSVPFSPKGGHAGPVPNANSNNASPSVLSELVVLVIPASLPPFLRFLLLSLGECGRNICQNALQLASSSDAGNEALAGFAGSAGRKSLFSSPGRGRQCAESASFFHD